MDNMIVRLLNLRVTISHNLNEVDYLFNGIIQLLYSHWTGDGQEQRKRVFISYYSLIYIYTTSHETRYGATHTIHPNIVKFYLIKS